MHKYAETVAEVDRCSRSGQKEQDLRRVIKEQTKQICQLQKDLTTAQKVVKPQPVRSNRDELDGLRQKLVEVREANDELIEERQTFIQVVAELEAQLKECHQHLEASMSRIQSQANEHDYFQKMLTKIAEIFEKKQID